MRLSWPKDNDKRRAVVRDDVLPTMESSAQKSTNLPFINTTWQDVEMHYHLSLRKQPFYVASSSPGPWRSSGLQANHMELVRYCKLEAVLCT
jgi:hypothetical protein